MEDPINPVDVNIDAETSPVSVESFGTTLFLSRHAVFSGVRTYLSHTGVAADFPAGTPENRFAEKFFAQTPRPDSLKIANNPASKNWSARITVNSVPEVGTTVSVSVVDATGTTRTGSYIIRPADTPALVAAGLHAVLDPLPGIATAYTVTETFFSLSSGGGDRLAVTSLHSSLAYLDTDTLGNYAARLSAVVEIDPEFFAVSIDATDALNIEAVGSWAEANERMFFAVTHDTREKLNSVLGVALQGLNLKNMEVRFNGKGERADAAMAAIITASTWDNGTAPTWAYRNLAGISVDPLTATEVAYLNSVGVQVNVRVKGVPVTWEGKTPSGVYGDFTVFLFWLKARIGEAVFSVLAREARLSYSTEDIAKAEAAVWEVLTLAASRGGFSPDFPLTISSPAPSEVSSVERGNRMLGGGGIRFSGTFAGAFYTIAVNGVVTV